MLTRKATDESNSSFLWERKNVDGPIKETDWTLLASAQHSNREVAIYLSALCLTSPHTFYLYFLCMQGWSKNLRKLFTHFCGVVLGMRIGFAWLVDIRFVPQCQVEISGSEILVLLVSYFSRNVCGDIIKRGCTLEYHHWCQIWEWLGEVVL